MTGRRALIGHTGFVGSNLKAASPFSDLFNSSNVEAMVGEDFDEIVCAGVPAIKWLANKEPEQDWAGIRRLLDVLERVTARRFVLVSTIDVYPDPSAGLDEDAAIDRVPSHPYGSHRRAIERFVGERFPNHLIVRLPALFGPGLKKNALFDLLHGNAVEKINPAGRFQWYPVTRLSRDIATVATAGLRLVNLFPAPVDMQTIIDGMFPGTAVGPAMRPAPSYDLRTKHAALFGRSDDYIMDADTVLADLEAYVAEERRI